MEVLVGKTDSTKAELVDVANFLSILVGNGVEETGMVTTLVVENVELCTVVRVPLDVGLADDGSRLVLAVSQSELNPLPLPI